MYIKEENNKIIVYEVILDEVELKKIKHELINNYSEVTIHREPRGTYRQNGKTYYDTYMIELISSDFVESYDTGDFYGTRVQVYDNQYKKYEYPQLVIYINEFLEGDFSNFPKLKELLKPRKIYRLTDKNRETISNLLPYREYIKQIVESITINKTEYSINSLSDMLKILEKLDECEMKSAVVEIKEKIEEDTKTLSYLMEGK